MVKIEERKDGCVEANYLLSVTCNFFVEVQHFDKLFHLITYLDKPYSKNVEMKKRVKRTLQFNTISLKKKYCQHLYFAY